MRAAVGCFNQGERYVSIREYPRRFTVRDTELTIELIADERKLLEVAARLERELSDYESGPNRYHDLAVPAMTRASSSALRSSHTAWATSITRE